VSIDLLIDAPCGVQLNRPPQFARCAFYLWLQTACSLKTQLWWWARLPSWQAWEQKSARERKLQVPLAAARLHTSAITCTSLALLCPAVVSCCKDVSLQSTLL
jgi:hypothetical protein